MSSHHHIGRASIGAVLIAAALSIASAQEPPPPSTKGAILYWTGIYDETGRCRYSIPPTWTVDGSGRHELARSPDGSVTLEQSWVAASSWPGYKTEVRRLLHPTVVREDSPLRLLFEYAAGWPGEHWYVAVPATTGVCATQIDIRPGARAVLEPTLQKIVQGIVAPE